MAIKKISKKFRFKDGRVVFAIFKRDIAGIEPCIYSTRTYRRSLTQEKQIVFEREDPKHKEFIEQFISRFYMEPLLDVMPIRYLFFFSIMPYLLFFDTVKNFLTCNVISGIYHEKQVIFCQVFTTAIKGVMNVKKA
ncbi:MAG: hypothetical protein LWW95_08505 [Candidatus Desulfofervidus auxilii]|nr:hypothetical protein [Candidatus Desulfofervidus auxilii]